MLNAELQCRFATIFIIAIGDTILLHFEFCILHSTLYERKYQIWIL